MLTRARSHPIILPLLLVIFLVPALVACEIDPAAARNREATAAAIEIASLKATIEAQKRLIAVAAQIPGASPTATPVVTPVDTPTAEATVEEVLSTVEPSPTVNATATLPATAERWKVAGTDGAGVYLRRTPKSADRVRAWPDDTVMERAGDDAQAEGRLWHMVKDPAGNVGNIPAEYLAPADGPSL